MRQSEPSEGAGVAPCPPGAEAWMKFKKKDRTKTEKHVIDETVSEFSE